LIVEAGKECGQVHLWFWRYRRAVDRLVVSDVQQELGVVIVD
jgi:hypothetical protein